MTDKEIDGLGVDALRGLARAFNKLQSETCPMESGEGECLRYQCRQWKRYAAEKGLDRNADAEEYDRELEMFPYFGCDCNGCLLEFELFKIQRSRK